ncbi:hypothetical protein HYH03_004644 [Edaphochlamys debaryana]|uniref:ADP,ATP carrier protein n=1 Tax=Edaphochlamys debaryana TaxID=47281 RepID=A0A835Y709_9CHLO|nr:hypothetical protein HYH03_004644 [Edaphochlamys debaryana]|eukprot:KAG2497492.1 hypothetical protein HYH03_004644 [Edaphochlamys debaryana]
MVHLAPVRTWLSYLCGYSLTPSEAATALHGFSAFGFLLGSYFILLPLREDVALALGPSVLPSLFTASLVVTALAAPAVTTYVVNPRGGSRAVGFGRLCRVMAGCLLVLCALLLATSPDPGAAARLLRGLAQGGGAGGWGPWWGRGPAGAPVAPAPPAPGSGTMGWYGNAVRVCFYVYLSLQSLLSTSTLWAVCADTFTPATSTRVYGLLGAGATLGQLLASAAALGFGTASKATSAAGAALWLLLPAAGMLLLSARQCTAMAVRAEAMHQTYDDAAAAKPRAGAGGGGGGGGGGGQGSASAYDDPAAKLGQAHSRAAAAAAGAGPAAGALPPPPPPPLDGGPPPHSVVDVRRGSTGGGGVDVTADGGKAVPTRGGGGGSAAAAAAGQHAGRLLEGFRLIAASRYLLAACAFLALNYATSATLYFLRAAVVSRSAWVGSGSSERIAFFAALNTASAALIFGAQLTLTGRALTSFGVGPVLLVGPAVSLGGMALICCTPGAATVAGVEVLRKVVQYALARPCREVLFTVVSREEKYSAKVVLDTVVQRLGDTAAAALFEVVGAPGSPPSTPAPQIAQY